MKKDKKQKGRWDEYSKVKCNCGHYPKDHALNGEGSCTKCGCTWYYPNDRWIMKNKKNNYKPVNIDTDFQGLGSFTEDKKVWKVASLIQHVKDQNLEVFELPLCGINLATTVWGDGGLTIKDFARYWKRANEANLDYPIILDDDGFIMDGWHRVAKALFLGLPTIKAVRFDKTPECDYIRSD